MADTQNTQSKFTIPKSVPGYMPGFFVFAGSRTSQNYEGVVELLNSHWEAYAATGKPRAPRGSKKRSAPEVTPQKDQPEQAREKRTERAVKRKKVVQAEELYSVLMKKLARVIELAGDGATEDADDLSTIAANLYRLAKGDDADGTEE